MHVSGIFCRRTVFTMAFLFLASGLVSCSGGKSGLNPVKGKVLYKDCARCWRPGDFPSCCGR